MGIQSWYINVGDTNGEERLWDIPISLMNMENPLYWLTQREGSFDLPLDVYNSSSSLPLILNYKSSGYYRVNYDEENWAWIAETLSQNLDAIDEFNRAGLFCDITVLHESGEVSDATYSQVVSKWEDSSITVGWARDLCENANIDKINLRKF